MAVYRCEVKTLKRALGRSAVAAAAYRAGERLRAEPNGDHQPEAKVFDYRKKAPGVAYADILAPSGAPEWATQRGRLWNEAERAENRRNSVTAREVLISLPHELDDQQRAQLVRGFASRLVARYGVAVDMAIHRPARAGDKRNHHAHLMMTTRRMDSAGFTEKTRELDDVKKRGPEEIEAIREIWEQEENRALQRANQPERVTRKSLAEQGIDREPQPKLGSAATALMRQGQPTRLGERWKEVADRNAMKANAARVMEMRQAEQAKPSPMRANMAAQAARRRAPQVEAEKQEAIKRALEAARQQKAREQGPAHIAEALMRDTTEAQRGQQDAEQAKKDEARKLDEERQKAAEVSAARAWERQRQAELRRQRHAREQAQHNEKDPGRTITPPGRKLD